MWQVAKGNMVTFLLSSVQWHTLLDQWRSAFDLTDQILLNIIDSCVSQVCMVTLHLSASRWAGFEHKIVFVGVEMCVKWDTWQDAERSKSESCSEHVRLNLNSQWWEHFPQKFVLHCRQFWLGLTKKNMHDINTLEMCSNHLKSLWGYMKSITSVLPTSVFLCVCMLGSCLKAGKHNAYLKYVLVCVVLGDDGGPVLSFPGAVAYLSV